MGKTTICANIRKMLKSVEWCYVNKRKESLHFFVQNLPVQKSVDNVEKSCFSTRILRFLTVLARADFPIFDKKTGRFLNA